MKHVHKQYNQAFLLEPTKLGRIVDTIHQRLADHLGTTTNDLFEVFLTGNRREEMTSLEDVLAIDNSRRHKIRRLLILCTASAPGAPRSEHEVQVDFAGPKPSSTNSNTKVVTIGVKSDAAGWSSRTLSEVEEQVERTWLRHGAPVIVMVLLLALTLIVLSSQFLHLHIGAQPDFMWLNEADLDRVEVLLAPGHTLTDAELREIATMQLRNTVNGRHPPSPPQANQSNHTLFVAVPLLVVLVCIVVLLVKCYPRTVFLWGDEVDRYNKIINLRRTIWGIIISLTIVGVLSKFLFEGVSIWLSRKT